MADHHYVSKFYYKNFTFNPERSLVYSMNNKGRISNRHKSFKKIGYEVDYNTCEQEKAQNRLETKYSRILRDFIKTADQVEYDFYFSDEFMEFVSFMVGNNIFVREKLVSVYKIEKIVQNGIELDNTIVMDKGYKGKFDWSEPFSGRVFKEFQNWVWRLEKLNIGPDKKGFITSDNPVSIFNPENVLTSIDVKLEHDWSQTKVAISNSKDRVDMDVVVTLANVSFGPDVVMTFPITPKLCLIGFSCNERHNSFKEESKCRLIEFINLMTLGQCNKAVYSHSKLLLAETRANLVSFRDYCDENNLTPTFEIGIQ